MENTALDLGGAGWDAFFGFGLIQMRAAIDRASRLPGPHRGGEGAEAAPSFTPITPTATSSPTPTPSKNAPGGGKVILGLNDNLAFRESSSALIAVRQISGRMYPTANRAAHTPAPPPVSVENRDQMRENYQVRNTGLQEQRERSRSSLAQIAIGMMMLGSGLFVGAVFLRRV